MMQAGITQEAAERQASPVGVPGRADPLGGLLDGPCQPGSEWNRGSGLEAGRPEPQNGPCRPSPGALLQGRAGQCSDDTARFWRPGRRFGPARTIPGCARPIVTV